MVVPMAVLIVARWAGSMAFRMDDRCSVRSVGHKACSLVVPMAVSTVARWDGSKADRKVARWAVHSVDQ